MINLFQFSPHIVPNSSLIASILQYNFTDNNKKLYILTNGDNPGNTIIYEVLEGTNYSSWKIDMSVALDAKNKIVFADGTLQRSHETHPSFRIWPRCNYMVRSWLLSSV